MTKLINFDAFESSADELRIKFCTAKPFPHVIIDNFLYKDELNKLMAEIGEPENDMRSSDYIFAKNKFENPLFMQTNKVGICLAEELCGERFEKFISFIYGSELFIDETFLGGGLHQGGTGSFLDMHADFNIHPTQKRWRRILNVLIYLNIDFKDEWGGHLELLNSKTCESNKVAPIHNRLVLLLTDEHTLHGYRKISFPDGKYRTSIAAYAYQNIEEGSVVSERSTLWRPDDGRPFKKLIATLTPRLVYYKSIIFGSATQRRANKKDVDHR